MFSYRGSVRGGYRGSRCGGDGGSVAVGCTAYIVRIRLGGRGGYGYGLTGHI